MASEALRYGAVLFAVLDAVVGLVEVALGSTLFGLLDLGSAAFFAVVYLEEGSC